MPPSPGDKLGSYGILSAIGAGGMGEVYKARDTRLDRMVAIKVLPEHITQREDLRARFEREARAVASLNHPNISDLYDIGPGDKRPCAGRQAPGGDVGERCERRKAAHSSNFFAELHG